jgi:uncharacterized membrane protein YphA (DoxX/SURF4 family)
METWLQSAAVPPLSGPFLAISVLLAIAGWMKLYRPGFTAGAIRAVGIPASDVIVRVLGAAELGVGIWAAMTGARAAAATVGMFYLGFTVFVVLALRNDSPISSCGCFGSEDTPPNIGHVLLDVSAATVAFWAALSPPGPWVGMIGEPMSAIVPFLLFTGATVYLLYAIVNVLPRSIPGTPARIIPLWPTRGR